MIVNNTCDALENLLLGDANAVKIKMIDNRNVEFTVNEFDGTVNMMFNTKMIHADGLPVVSHKLHKITYDYEMMNGNSIKDSIDYILETMEDKLNEDFGIIPIGINRWKSSNCLEF